MIKDEIKFNVKSFESEESEEEEEIKINNSKK